jgi:hypothetical protein
MKYCIQAAVVCLAVLAIVACMPAATSTPVAVLSTSVPTASPTGTPTPTLTPSPVPTPMPTPIPLPTPNPYTESGARQKYSYDEIVLHLDTPSLLLAFMRNNLKWQGNWDMVHYGGNTYATAAEVYANGVDDCDGLAEFGACVLSSHGFEAYNVGVSIDSQLGHNITGFVDPGDGKMYAINNGREQVGPFNSWLELAQYFIDKGDAEPNKVIWLFKPCISQTTGDVEKLSHKVIR